MTIHSGWSLKDNVKINRLFSGLPMCLLGIQAHFMTGVEPDCVHVQDNILRFVQFSVIGCASQCSRLTMWILQRFILSLVWQCKEQYNLNQSNISWNTSQISYRKSPQ